MEIFKEIKIDVDSNDFSIFKTSLIDAICTPWSFEVERNLDNIQKGAISVSFSLRDSLLPDANLSLFWMDGSATIGNIVPPEFGQLSKQEYNLILDDFYNKFLNPILEKSGLRHEVSADEFVLSEQLEAPVYKKLVAFSASANKGSAVSHPSDEARWLDFVVACYDAQFRLSPEMLGRWLNEEAEWPLSVAHELQRKYDDAIELLNRYNQG